VVDDVTATKSESQLGPAAKLYAKWYLSSNDRTAAASKTNEDEGGQERLGEAEA